MRLSFLFHFLPQHLPARSVTLATVTRVSVLALAASALTFPGNAIAQQDNGTDNAGSGIAAAPSPNDALPAQPIGGDDLLGISVPYCPELSRSFRVSADGKLALPLLKQPIDVAGEMPQAVAKEIATALQQDQILNQPIVSVSILEYRSRPISVVGAVKNPVTFQASRDTTLLDAITRAGGLTPAVGPDITVTHHEQLADGTTNVTVQSIPVKGLIEATDAKLNIRLTGNDEVRVPDAGRIFVAGNVKKPGSFAMQDDSDTTVVKALAMSEGLDSYSAKQAFIYREQAPGQPRQEISVELSKIMSRKAPDVVLKPDDILYIPADNGKRMTARVLEQLAGFGSSTAAGVLIYR